MEGGEYVAEGPTNEVTADSPTGVSQGRKAQIRARSVSFKLPIDIESMHSLESYVSAPASTYSALRVLEDEEKLQEELERTELNGEESVTEKQASTVMSPFTFDIQDKMCGDRSWLRNRKKRPSLSELGPGKTLAGDLASPKIKADHRPANANTLFEFFTHPKSEGGNDVLRPSVRQTNANQDWEAQIVDDLHRDSSDDDDQVAEILSLSEHDFMFEDVDDIDESEEQEKRPFFKRKAVWVWIIIGTFQLLFVALGIAHLTLASASFRQSWQVWRLCFFLAFLPFCWIIGTILTSLTIILVERMFMLYPDALYYTYSVKNHVKWVFRGIAVVVSWALFMFVNDEGQTSAVNTANSVILRLFGCITLFMVANLIKRLLAKMMSLKFTGSNQKAKMEVALKKEQLLKALMRPRPKMDMEGDESIMYRGVGSLFNMMTKGSADQAAKRRLELKSDVVLDQRMSFGFQNRRTQSFTLGESKSAKSSPARALADTRTLSPSFARSLDLRKGPFELSEGQIGIARPGDQTPSPQAKHNSSANNQEASATNQETGTDTLPHLPSIKIQIDEESPKKQGRILDKISPLLKNPLSPVKALVSPSNKDGDGKAEEKKKSAALTRAQKLERLNKLEKYIRKHNIQITFRDELNRMNNSSFQSDKDARKVATFLFWNIKHDVDSHYIFKDDLKPFVDEEDLDLAFNMLDTNADGKVNIRDCVSAVEAIYHERCNLASTLRDTKSITRVLETLIGIVIHTIFVFLYLLVFQVNVGQIWVGFSGLILSFSFIFSTTVSNVFENIVFLFGVHPFDIGDTLLINDQYLTVDEITINFTVFISGYNLRVWMPNTVLGSNTFVNLTTSGTKWEVITCYVDIDTDPSILQKIEEACKEVRTKNSSEYGPGYRCKFAAAQDPFKIGIQIVFEYSHQGIDFHRTAVARSWMYETMARILTENNVQYTWPLTKAEAALFQNRTNNNNNTPEGQAGEPRHDSSRGGRSVLGMPIPFNNAA